MYVPLASSSPNMIIATKATRRIGLFMLAPLAHRARTGVVVALREAKACSAHRSSDRRRGIRALTVMRHLDDLGRLDVGVGASP